MGEALAYIEKELSELEQKLAAYQAEYASPGTTAGRKDAIIEKQIALKAEIKAKGLDRARQIDSDRLAAAQADGLLLDAERRRLDDEATFWFRRSFTTLAIANAAAFVALAGGFMQADDKATLAKAIAGPMAYFIAGMLTAGLMPLILWAQAAVQAKSLNLAHMQKHVERVRAVTTVVCAILAGSAALALYLGLLESVGVVRGLAR